MMAGAIFAVCDVATPGRDCGGSSPAASSISAGAAAARGGGCRRVLVDSVDVEARPCDCGLGRGCRSFSSGGLGPADRWGQ